MPFSESGFVHNESGRLLFEARARLAAGADVDRDVIQSNLEAIAQDLMVDIRGLD
jgi:glycine cleavage system regulatory protein